MLPEIPRLRQHAVVQPVHGLDGPGFFAIAPRRVSTVSGAGRRESAQSVMHELSAATSLVELACEKARELGDVRVEALHLRLGPLAGVVKEALLFSFEVAAQGTPIQGARLEIQDMPLTVLCPSCAEERELASAQHRRCPVCDTPTPVLRGGRELELAALEVSENAAANR